MSGEPTGPVDEVISTERFQAHHERKAVAESAARLALLARRHGDLEGSREWLSEATVAADASDDPETLQYLREVTAQVED